MIKLELLIYYTFICGLLAVLSPVMSNTVSRLIFGSVLGIVATISWPSIQLLLHH